VVRRLSFSYRGHRFEANLFVCDVVSVFPGARRMGLMGLRVAGIVGLRSSSFGEEQFFKQREIQELMGRFLLTTQSPH
jgi:hypothetical protein